MKSLMILMLGALLLTVSACQYDMTGRPASSETNGAMESSSSRVHPDVPKGDVYFETYIGRYDMGS
jgi:hypothetical protein